MPSQAEWYRLLQRHLDSQPVGFPATQSGTDLRLLEKLFTLEEAQVALQLSFRPSQLAEIAKRTAPTFSNEQTEQLLEAMEDKGVIAWKSRNGVDHWHLLPLVVGMYEWVEQGGKVKGFGPVVGAYMMSPEFGQALLSTRPSQVHTVPIGESLTVEHAVAPYDDMRAQIRAATGPFALFPCVCRESSRSRGNPCKKTTRTDSCLALDDLAAALLRRGLGREVTRDEVLETLHASEDEGLVVQPANNQRPGFVCFCCGCCCGLLVTQKLIPHPVDFWSNNYQVAVNDGGCNACGACTERCQVNALSSNGPDGTVQVDPTRCIGCGLCVPACPSQTLHLVRKETATAPPADELALYEEIQRNRQRAESRKPT